MLIDDTKDAKHKTDVVGYYLSSYTAKKLQAWSYAARPFVFDRAASVKLGHFIRDCADVIADNLDFALPPYETTYIEVEMDAVIEGIGSGSTLTGPDADWKVGFLIKNGSVMVLANTRRLPSATFMPFGLDRHDGLRTDAEFAPDYDRHSMILLGSSMPKLTPKQIRAFNERWALVYNGPEPIRAQMLAEPVMGHAGECRTLCAALLLLNQKKVIQLTDKPAHRQMHRGKSRSFMAHSVVTITLDSPVEIRRSMHTGERESPRAHEVPAHFAHRHGEKLCEHNWIKRDDGHEHWDCTKCGRFRYRRKEHMRGDASKGFVKRTYNVTAEKK